MKLYYAPTSPFARKARIAALELGLDSQIDLIESNPWTDEPLRTINPLAKVPALIRADGGALYESAVICDYLDEYAGRRLFPGHGPERWRALLLQGLADGASTAAGRLFADQRRPADERSESMMARFTAAIDAALDQLESTPLYDKRLTIGEISAAAFLAYLDFRWPDRDWRGGRKRLADWFALMEQRPSMLATAYRTFPA